MKDGPNFQQFYYAFRDIIATVHSSTSLEEVMNLVVWKASEVLQADGALMRLLNLDTNELEISASYGLSDAYLSKGPVLSSTMITDLCRRKKMIIIDDIRHDPRIQYPEEVAREGIEFVIDIPLMIANDIGGILRLFFAEFRRFSEEERNFIVAVAEQCSCALGKAHMIEAYELKYHQLAIQTEKLSSLGRMAAGIAHEINNPLAGILLYSSNMIKKVPADGPLGEGLKVVIDETIRCRKIIQELLDFSRGREPVKTPANINDVIEKALKILENEFLLSRISISRSLAADMQETMLDGNQMEQVFVNLLLNAIEAVAEDGTVSITSTVRDVDAVIAVEIADDGPGIEAEELDKIFEPFYSTKPKGTGLGLSVSYGIVRSHQGVIRVDSRPGGGTRFTIEIPLTREDNRHET